MKKIAIYGGSFDPITNAHLSIAEQIRDILKCNVVFLPTKQARWKDNAATCKTHRLNMLKLAIEGKNGLEINTLEVDKKSNKVNYTIDTILELLDIYKGYKIYYIIGTDQLNKLDKWKDIDDLSKLVTFVLVNREGYTPNTKNIEKYGVIDSKINMSDTSSTLVREFKSFDCPNKVLDYIKKKSLYIKEDLKIRLKKDRYEHSVRVANLARKIAKSNGFDADKAYCAGLIHDCAKNINQTKSIEMMLKYEPEHIGESHKIYHQYLAPIIAKDVYHIDDEDILHAIKYHTTGSLDMNTLDKIIYVSDKIEPGREYDSSFFINKCIEDIEVGFLYVLIANLEFVRNKNPNTIDKNSAILYKNALKDFEIYELEKIITTIDEKYGSDIKVYDVSNKNPLTKYMIICSAQSIRHSKSLGENIIDCLLENQFDYHHKEMDKDSGWTLIDANSFIINIVSKENREHYKFEEIYNDCSEININYLIKE